MNERNALHSLEIENLKRDVAEMRKNMGFDDDLFDDLDDFDKKVSFMRAKVFALINREKTFFLMNSFEF